MVNYISIVSHQGKLFVSAPKPEQDGLLAVVDLKNKSQTYIPVDVSFNGVGDAFLISDSHGQVTLFHLANNRYLTIVSDLKQVATTVSFISKSPQEQIFIALKNKAIQIHAINGKTVDKFQPNLHHNTEVKSTSNNVKMGLLLSVSSDVCILWSTNQGSQLIKQRSIFSKQGCTFSQAIFTFDGQGVATLFKDGELLIWTLDTCDSAQNQRALHFKTNQVTNFDISPAFVFASGTTCPYIIVKSLKQNTVSIEDRYFRLPGGCQGAENIKLLRDQNSLCFLAQGYFYVIDISNANSQKTSIQLDTLDKLKIKLNIRIPGQSIKHYDVDYNMGCLILTTAAGSIFIYDLQKALENENILNKKKLQMGLEDEVIYTYLQEVSQQDFLQQSMSSLSLEQDANNNVSIISQMQQQNQRENIQFRENETLNFAREGQESIRIESNQNLNPNQFGQYQNTLAPMAKTQENVINPFMSRQSTDFDDQTTSVIHQQSTVKQRFDQQQQQQQYQMPSSYSQQMLSSIQTTQKPAPIVQFTQNRSTIGINPMNPYDDQEYIANTINGGLSTQSIMSSNNINTKSTLNKTKNKTKNNQTVNQSKIGTSQMQTSQQQQQQKSQFHMSIDDNYEPDFKMTNSTLQQSTMAQFNLPKLKQMLKSFGEYPDKYRTLTWKYLLDLPLNQEAFQSLLRRGVHPVYKQLHKKYPIDSYKLYNKLVRILSAIAYWCPLFIDVEFMPQIVFPFIKTIPNDDLVVFELVVSIVMQWMQCWFENYPGAPCSSVLASIEHILEQEDPQLVNHLRANAFTPTHYAWPLLTGLLTDVLPKEDWLKALDYIFTYRDDPELINYICAAFLIQSKGTLLQLQTIEQLHTFLSRPSGSNFKKIMEKAFRLHTKYKNQIASGYPSNNLPLSKDTQEYPLFVRYPEQIISYQAKIREKIMMEEEEIQRKEQLLLDLKQQAEEVLIQEQKFRIQQEASIKAEGERKQKLQEQQEAMLQERMRLDELARIARLEHIKRIEGALSGAFTQQQQLKEQEAHLADSEFQQRQRAAHYEYEARMQDEMIANLEFKSNQKLLELMQKRQSEDQVRKLKSELEQRQKEEDQRDRVMREKWRLEDQEQRLKSELLRQTLHSESQQMSQQAERTKMEQRLRIQEYEKEMQLLKIEEQRKLRQMEEECILRKQQAVEDMKKKVDSKSQYETQMMWKKMDEEREKERTETAARISQLDEEKRKLERALDQEKEERERLEQLERQNQYQQQFDDAKKKASQESGTEQVRMQMERERAEAEQSKHQMMKKEIQIRESKQDFMQYIRDTESNINQKVEAIEQKQKAYESSGSSSQLEVRKKEEYEGRMRRLAEEREKQYREQNESLANKIVNQSRVFSEQNNDNDQENINTNINSDQLYQQRHQQDQQQYYQRSFGYQHQQQQYQDQYGQNPLKSSGQQQYQQQPYDEFYKGDSLGIPVSSLHSNEGEVKQYYQDQQQKSYNNQYQPEGFNYSQDNAHNNRGGIQRQISESSYRSGSSADNDSQRSHGNDDSSSLTSSHNTQALIERHYKAKQAFEDHKKTQSVSNVFNYNQMAPQVSTSIPPYQYQPSYTQQQNQQIASSSNNYPIHRQEPPQYQQQPYEHEIRSKSKNSQLSDSHNESNLESSSSSEDEFSMSSRSSNSHATSHLQQPSNQKYQQQHQSAYQQSAVPPQFYQASQQQQHQQPMDGYSSYTSSSLNSSLQTSQYGNTQPLTNASQYR